MTYTLRPLSLGELLDRTFSFYRRHFVLFVGIAALPNIFTLLLTVSLAVAGSGVGGQPWFMLVSVVATMFVYLVATAFTQGATVIAVSQIQLGKETNIAEAFSSIRPRLGELVMLSLNVGVRVGLGFLLLIVPGVVLALRYALATPVAVLEQKTISESLTRSTELTKGHRGRVFLIYSLLFILAMVVSAVWQVPITMLSGSVEGGDVPTWAEIAIRFGDFVTQSILGPVMTIAIALVYYDQRVRKEAFDLEHMMQKIDQLALEPSATV